MATDDTALFVEKIGEEFEINTGHLRARIRWVDPPDLADEDHRFTYGDLSINIGGRNISLLAERKRRAWRGGWHVLLEPLKEWLSETYSDGVLLFSSNISDWTFDFPALRAELDRTAGTVCLSIEDNDDFSKTVSQCEFYRFISLLIFGIESHYLRQYCC